jgi:hypothetical protein
VQIGLVDFERLLIRLDRRVVVAELGLFEQGDRVERREPLAGSSRYSSASR